MVTMLTKSMKANLGIMITAIILFMITFLKLFGPDGLKLSDKIEKIEKIIDSNTTHQLSNPEILGRVKD